jgi:syringate O-demethylase
LPEYTNWRDEQWAWQNTAVVFNQSYHMTDLYVTGPDAFALLESLGINSFKGFVPGKAKQYVPVSWDGFVIGDVVLCYLAPESFNLIGRPPVHNWVQYHGETGTKPDGSKWNVKFERDERSASRPNPTARKTYRYQVQGPNAMKVMTKVLGKAPPDLKFFNMEDITIAGKKVTALRHGMASLATSCSDRRPMARWCSMRSSRRARSSACAWSVREPTRPTPWNQAGSPRRWPPSIRATRA